MKPLCAVCGLFEKLSCCAQKRARRKIEISVRRLLCPCARMEGARARVCLTFQSDFSSVASSSLLCSFSFCIHTAPSRKEKCQNECFMTAAYIFPLSSMGISGTSHASYHTLMNMRARHCARVQQKLRVRTGATGNSSCENLGNWINQLCSSSWGLLFFNHENGLGERVSEWEHNAWEACFSSKVLWNAQPPSQRVTFHINSTVVRFVRAFSFCVF